MGKRIWRCYLRIRLNIGPLDAAQRDRCLPQGAIAAGMKRMLQRFGMFNLDCEVRLLLKPECVKPAVLNPNQPAPDRLGWEVFLITVPGDATAADVCSLFKTHAARSPAGRALQRDDKNCQAAPNGQSKIKDKS